MFKDLKYMISRQSHGFSYNLGIIALTTGINCTRYRSCNYFAHCSCMQWPIRTIGSRDYCHAPLGVRSFSFAIQNVWKMTTVVDKIACRMCTACPPSIVLRLFIADTISSATICRQYVKSLRTRQKHGKFSCHNCGTTARPTKNQLTRPILIDS